VVDDALDRLEKIEKSSSKNCEATQKISVLLSKLFENNSDGQSKVRASGGFEYVF